MARKVFTVSALTVALEGTKGDEEGVLDVHAVVCPGGRMLKEKAALSTLMIDRRGPLGADDHGEQGVRDVRIQLLPWRETMVARRAYSMSTPPNCPGGRILMAGGRSQCP